MAEDEPTPPLDEINPELEEDPFSNSKEFADPPKKPRGRPKGSKKNYKINEFQMQGWNQHEGFIPSDKTARRNYSTSISTVLRERVDPNILFEFQWMVLMGKNPVMESDGNGGWRVIEDRNPNAPPPTLEQRQSVVKWITDRRDGMAPQQVHIEAMLKATIQPEIPAEIMAALDPRQLVLLTQALLPAPKEEEIEDAEVLLEEKNE